VRDVGTPVAIRATASPGYRFDHWEGDAKGTNRQAVVRMTANRVVTAVFVKTYTLTMAVSSPYGGSVTPSVGTRTYDAGTVVTLRATPKRGYHFDHWEGDVTGILNPTSVTMNASRTVKAVFHLNP